MFGQMDLTKRKSELEKFVSGNSSFLVVTDLCARGIDIPDVELVINYDFPTNLKTFIHRCGRTARVEREGRAYSLVTRDELHFMVEVQRALEIRKFNNFNNIKEKNLIEEKQTHQNIKKLVKGIEFFF